jgi:ligand-binding sensor domain-containing protein
MRLLVSKLYFLLFICVSSPWLDAQQYGYTQYDMASGAPFNEVNSVVKDHLGYIWIASPNGLYRFDGVSYDNFSIHTQSQYIHQLERTGRKVAVCE